MSNDNNEEKGGVSPHKKHESSGVYTIITVLLNISAFILSFRSSFFVLLAALLCSFILAIFDFNNSRKGILRGVGIFFLLIIVLLLVGLGLCFLMLRNI